MSNETNSEFFVPPVKDDNGKIIFAVTPPNFETRRLGFQAHVNAIVQGIPVAASGIGHSPAEAFHRALGMTVPDMPPTSFSPPRIMHDTIMSPAEIGYTDEAGVRRIFSHQAETMEGCIAGAFGNVVRHWRQAGAEVAP